MQDVAATVATLERFAPSPVEVPALPPTTSRRRLTAAITGLVVVVLATLLADGARGVVTLPDTVEDLNAAVAASASLTTCFEGVRDEIAGGLRPDGSIAPLAATVAAERLATCDPADLTARVVAVRVPIAAPVITSATRTDVHDGISAAVAALTASVDDAEAAHEALTAQLDAGSGFDVAADRAVQAVTDGHDALGSVAFRVEHQVRDLQG